MNHFELLMFSEPLRKVAHKVLAVLAVCSELVSAGFPVMQGKYREILRKWRRSRPTSSSNQLKFLSIIGKFPAQRNREILKPDRELIPRNRELSSGSGKLGTICGRFKLRAQSHLYRIRITARKKGRAIRPCLQFQMSTFLLYPRRHLHQLLNILRCFQS